MSSDEEDEAPRPGLGAASRRNPAAGLEDVLGLDDDASATRHQPAAARESRDILGAVLRRPMQFVTHGAEGSEAAASASSPAAPAPAPAPAPQQPPPPAPEPVVAPAPTFKTFGKRRRGEDARQQHKQAQPQQASANPFSSFNSRAVSDVAKKIMLNMGFKGRLGKGEQGIAAPVAAKLRPQGVGLGYGVPETPVVPSAAKQEQREPGAEEGSAATTAAPARKARPQQWKRGAAKRKTVYLTAEELVRQQGTQARHGDRASDEDESDGEARVAKRARPVAAAGAPAAVPEVVIDYTGAQVRVTTLDKLGRTEAAAPSTATTFLPELEHNMRLLVDLTEADIIQTHGRRKQLEQRLATLRAEEQRLKAAEERAAEDVRAGEALLAKMEAVDARLQARSEPRRDAAEAVALVGGVCDALEEMQQQHPAQFRALSLPSWGVARALPLLREAVQTWTPLAEVIDSAARIDGEGDAAQRDVELRSRLPWLAPLLRLRGLALERDYTALVEALLLPKLHTSLSAVHDAAAAAAVGELKQVMEVALPAEELDALLRQVLVPRVGEMIEAWAPTADGVGGASLHELVSPWLLVLGAEASEPVLAAVERRLAVFFSSWHPSNAAGRALLQPWLRVLEPDVVDRLLVRSVLPRLAQVLDREVQINPANQRLETLRSVLDWADLVPLRLVSRLLRAFFFPKWLRALYQWLRGATKPDPAELTRWHTGWKTRVLPLHVAALPEIEVVFARAQAMINQASAPDRNALARVEGLMEETLTAMRQDGPEALLALAGGAHVMADETDERVARMHGFASVAMQENDDEDEEGDGELAPAEVPMREVVEKMAAHYGVLFEPHPTRGAVDGNPVFKFGPASIYVSGRSVFVAEPGGRWRVVSLPALLELARSEAPPSRAHVHPHSNDVD